MCTAFDRRPFRVALVALSWILPAVASAALQSAGTPDVSFTAQGPAGLHIVGTTHDLTLIDDGTTLTVRVPLAGLKTGIGLRDKHMKDHLDVEHYHDAVLTTPKASLKLPAASSVKGAARGKLMLRGQARDATFNYTATRAGAEIEVQGTMRVNMNDYGINVPSYLGVTVRPDVDIAVHFTVRDR